MKSSNKVGLILFLSFVFSQVLVQCTDNLTQDRQQLSTHVR